MGRYKSFLGQEFDVESIACLKVGCGSGANLWMLVEQSFRITGLDISPESLNLAHKMLQARGFSANLVEASMVDIPFEKSSFNLIVDVFSSYCLDMVEFQRYLSEAVRVLKIDGRLFLYTPSKRSDAYLDHAPVRLIDSCTLDPIKRTNSPFFGNNYSFRFEAKSELIARLNSSSFRVDYIETVSRSYGNGSEYFEFIVIEAIKK